MSSSTPKSKSKWDKSEFASCVACGVVVSTRDMSLHTQYCDQNVTNHGHAKNGLFYPIHTQLKLKDDDLKRLPEPKSHLVLLHPSVMRLSRIQIGQPVLVNGDELRLAWPCTALHPMAAHLFGFNAKSLISIQPYEAHLTEAAEIYIEAEQDSKFQRQLLLQNCHNFIRDGISLKCNYFGLQTTTRVLKIVALDGIVHQNSTNLESTFSNMQISPIKSLLPTSMASPIASNYRPVHTYELNAAHNPSYLILSPNTIVKCEHIQKDDNSIKYNLIGGLGAEIKSIRESIGLFFNKRSLNEVYAVEPSYCLLLYGPPGTGKTMIGRAVENEEKNVEFVELQTRDLFSKYYGETESKIKEIFQIAIEKSPCILFIDEIDVICSKKENQSDVEKRVTGVLLYAIDSLKNKGVFLLAVTNSPDCLDPRLRHPNRLDREIEIGIPSPVQRVYILTIQLSTLPHTLTTEQIESISSIAHSYSGADLAAVIREAASRVATATVSFQLNFDCMLQAMKKHKPSGMKEVCIQVPKVLWSEIGGMGRVKDKLVQVVEWPLKYPQAFKRMGVHPPRGLLMYGPPGCSKTMIAKALATESGLNFLAIKGPELFNKWVGESERAVRELFRKARQVAPSIIFFDEIDALASERSGSSSGTNVGNRVLAQLLTELDGIEQLEGVAIVAATNRPDMIDQALLRPGRLDSIIYVPLPDEQSRRDILELQRDKMPIERDVDTGHLSQLTEGYSGAEIVAVCQEAGLAALTENVEAELITQKHFELALGVVKPRTTRETIRFYKEYYEKSMK